MLLNEKTKRRRETLLVLEILAAAGNLQRQSVHKTLSSYFIPHSCQRQLEIRMFFQSEPQQRILCNHGKMREKVSCLPGVDYVLSCGITNFLGSDYFSALLHVSDTRKMDLFGRNNSLFTSELFCVLQPSVEKGSVYSVKHFQKLYLHFLVTLLQFLLTLGTFCLTSLLFSVVF